MGCQDRVQVPPRDDIPAQGVARQLLMLLRREEGLLRISVAIGFFNVFNTEALKQGCQIKATKI